MTRQHPSATAAPLGDLRIDAVATPSGALLGMSHCPGRRGVDGSGREWQRDLAQDLAAIESWGASTVLSLVEADEFARLGVADFTQAIGQTTLAWLHIPIPDMGTPDAITRAAWHTHSPALAGALDRGERVLVHCAAGLGRTGMVVAKLLVAQGCTAEQAITQVRSARPGTIETPAQAEFVHRGLLAGLIKTASVAI